MATEKETNEAAPQDETKPKGKGKLMVFSSLGIDAAAGAIAAMLAIPSKQVSHRFKGPFTTPLFEDQFSCNLVEREHYLQMKPEVMYQVYEADYLTTRVTDQLYLPQMKNAVLRIASNKSMEDLFGEANQDGFMEELSEALDPVLFPVHIGETKLPWDPDEDSGLRPGLSMDKTNFRGNFFDHTLQVDSEERTLQLDDGPVTTFKSGDPDVRVVDSNGAVIFVDVSGLSEEFSGPVQLGVRGRIIKILPLDMLIQ
jgi:flagellar basal body-associated protein FliL